MSRLLRKISIKPFETKYIFPVLLGMVLGCGALLRFYGIKFGEPYLYHPDEIKLVAQAGRLLQTRFIDFHAYFAIGVYPPFYTYMLALVMGCYIMVGFLLGKFDSFEAVKAVYETNPFSFFLAGRILVAILGILSIYILYRIVRKFYPKRIAWMASALMAVDFVHVRNSHFSTVDVPAVFFVLCAIYFMANMLTESEIRNYILAAIFMALAVATKFSTYLLVLPFLVVHFYKGWKNGGKIRNFLNKKLYTAIIIGFLAFSLACPLFILDFNESYGGIVGTKKFEKIGKLGSGGGFLSYWTGDQSPGFGVFYPNSIPACYGIPFTLLAPVGILIMLMQPRKGLFILLFPLVTYVQFEGLAYKAMRHILPALPFLAISTAVAVDFFIQKIKVTRIRNFFLVTTIFILCAAGFIKGINYFNKIKKPDPRTQASIWLQKNIPPRAKIATESFAPPLPTIAKLDNPDSVKALLNSGYYLYPVELTTKEHDVSMKLIKFVRENHLDYYISDGFTRQILTWKQTARKYNEIIEDRNVFFTWLQNNSTVIARFQADDDIMQPTIVVYKLKL